MSSRTPRVAVKALIVRNRQVLMNRYVHPAGHEMFELPGGGQEHGEDQPTALIRECQEEIGARVNVAYWCGLAEGEEPGEGTAPDGRQAGTAWLPLDRLGGYDVKPPALARWLESDPSDRPISLGVSRA